MNLLRYSYIFLGGGGGLRAGPFEPFEFAEIFQYMKISSICVIFIQRTSLIC